MSLSSDVRSGWASGPSERCGHARSAGLQPIDGPCQEVPGVDFVVTVRADEQQVMDIEAGQQPVQRLECRRIRPLQIVQKHNQRMLAPGERADEALEHVPESIARLRRIEWRRCGLLTENQLDLRDDLRQDSAVCPERFGQTSPPFRKPLLAFGQ